MTRPTCDAGICNSSYYHQLGHLIYACPKACPQAINTVQSLLSSTALQLSVGLMQVTYEFIANHYGDPYNPGLYTALSLFAEQPYLPYHSWSRLAMFIAGQIWLCSFRQSSDCRSLSEPQSGFLHCSTLSQAVTIHHVWVIFIGMYNVHTFSTLLQLCLSITCCQCQSASDNYFRLAAGPVRTTVQIRYILDMRAITIQSLFMRHASFYFESQHSFTKLCFLLSK